MLLLKSDVLDTRERERPESLGSSATARFRLVPEDEEPDELFALDRKGAGKKACGGGG